jgi:hypothetical protein
MAEQRTKKQKLEARHNGLKSERASWDEHWRDIGDHVKPRNQGGKKNDRIINNTATRGARVMPSGIMAGLTSPGQPWFRLTTPDPRLAEVGAVKQWLYMVEERIRVVLARSNIYNALHTVYEDLVWAGTACLHIEADEEDIVRAYVFPIGQYCLANSARQSVDTVFREYSMTVAQLVEQFGEEKCSTTVRRMYKECKYDEWREVVLAIEPNRDYQEGKLGPAGMRYKSTWFEKGGDDAHLLLKEGGFHVNPCMVPRWAATAEDVYGGSPAMEALGDIKALQVLEKRSAQLVDKLSTPPMVGPSTIHEFSLLPGALTRVAGLGAGMEFKPAIVVHPQAVEVVELKIRQHEERIDRAFYADLWLMLANSEGPQMTAEEIKEKHSEKMLQLGPVITRMQDELLDPLIDRVFGILVEAGYIPPPPEELPEGAELKVEYTSQLAQAVKLMGVNGMKALSLFVQGLAAVKEDVVDKLDLDQMVDEYGLMLGTPPSIVRTDEQVAAIRAQRAQMQQAQAQAEMAASATQSAKTLSETDIAGDNLLTKMLGNIPGAEAGAMPQ